MRKKIFLEWVDYGLWNGRLPIRGPSSPCTAFQQKRNRMFVYIAATTGGLCPPCPTDIPPEVFTNIRKDDRIRARSRLRSRDCNMRKGRPLPGRLFFWFRCRRLICIRYDQRSSLLQTVVMLFIVPDASLHVATTLNMVYSSRL